MSLKILKISVSWTAKIGTAVLLIALVFSCATVPELRDESGGNYIRVPFVRVHLDESQNEVVVNGDGQFVVECLTGKQQQVFYSTNPVKISNSGRLLKVENNKGMVLGENLDEVNVIPRGTGNRLRLNKSRYRGLLKALPAGRNVQIINVLYIEDYLYGVVPPEIGLRQESEIEAVKAQAVAARTYTLSHLQQYDGEAYDLKNTIIDQVYRGVETENKLINRAINETAGRVIMYHDEYIRAYYHSTCGGFTDAISSVWDRAELPYLKSVEDSGACSWSKYYIWKEVFTEEQLRGRIEQYLSADRGRDLKIGRILDISIMERTPGGRITTLKIKTTSDTYKFHKDRIRWVLGRTSNPDLILPSDRFDVSIARDKQGYLTRATIKGRGYGHGVGMCQCGAIGMARDSRTYQQIIHHYYTDVDIKKPY